MAVIAAAAVPAAQAHGHGWSGGFVAGFQAGPVVFGVGHPRVYYAPPPVYVAPTPVVVAPPVYVAPRPVVMAPPRVVVAPPVYVAPPPVYVPPPVWPGGTFHIGLGVNWRW